MNNVMFSHNTYFHELLELHPIIHFIKGRLRFSDKGTAPFPSLILEFDYPQCVNFYRVWNQ